MDDEQDQPTTADNDSSPGTDEAAGGPDWQTEARKWRDLARKHEQRAKSNAAAARRLAEIEDTSKSETERLTERATTVETERDQLRGELARLRVALRHGLGEEDLDFLTGTDEEQVDERARRLVARLTKTPTAPALPAKPAERLTAAGTASDNQPDADTDPLRLADRIRAHSA